MIQQPPVCRDLVDPKVSTVTARFCPFYRILQQIECKGARQALAQVLRMCPGKAHFQVLLES